MYLNTVFLFVFKIIYEVFCLCVCMCMTRRRLEFARVVGDLSEVGGREPECRMGTSHAMQRGRAGAAVHGCFQKREPENSG